MHFTPPQLARPFTIERFNKKPASHWADWSMEPKHDGMRAIVHRSDEGVEIYSRSGKPYATHVPALVKEFEKLPIGTILDGELAVINGFHSLLHVPVVGVRHAEVYKVPIVDFNKTMRIMGTGFEKAIKRQDPASGDDKDNPFVGEMSFIAFDILQYGYNDITQMGQSFRSVSLSHTVMAVNSPSIIRNPVMPVDISIYDELVAAGIEGVILKSNNGQYTEGRNSDWLKLKSEKTFDVVVMGFTDAKEGKTGKWLGKIGAIEFGAYLPDGTLQYVGRCSGMDDETRDMWTLASDNWNEDDDYGVHVIEVKANELVGSGEYKTPRHPQYVTQRIDKNAVDCKMDQFSGS
jgi:ATP-dependent DNA ligase